MPDLYEYGVAVHLYKPIIKRAVVDFAVGADWTPAAGDVTISKDGGAAANVTNLPVAITMGNTAMWDYSLTATEMQAAKVRIMVADAATKAVEDTMFEIDTYGNASAQHKVNLNDSVRAGLTALPNAAAEAAGGLYTRGTGAGQINQPANGMIDGNLVRWLGTAAATPTVAGVPEVDLTHMAGSVNGLARLERAARAMALVTVGAAATTTSIPTSSMAPAAAVADQFKNAVLVFDLDTATANLRGQRTRITGSTSGGVLTVSPALTTAPASGDTAVVV